MIGQLLNRSFLVHSIERLRRDAEQEARLWKVDDADAKARAAAGQVTLDDLQAAESALAAVARDLGAQASSDADDSAFFPREGVAALAQSALLEFFETQRPDLIETTVARGAIAQTPAVTDRQLKGISFTGDQRGLFGAFEQTDVRWAASLVAQAIRAVRGRRPFNPKAAPLVPLANRARVLLVGDWGSGLPRARRVGAAMRTVLEEPGAAQRDQHVIHLGDVYYSGWKREYERHFLPHWPVRPGEESRIGSWALNANHDMFSGGHGYYDCLLKDPRFERQAQSSFFGLANDHWQILGLDTGYAEHDLFGDQAAYAQAVAAEAAGKDLLLLSHHQPFSAYERGGTELVAKLQPLLAARRVRAWFWGHEHRCACYAARDGIEYPRLLGHGGIPVYASSGDRPPGVIYEYQGALDTGLERWALFGFAVLDFEDKNIHVRYINENGALHHSETLRSAR